MYICRLTAGMELYDPSKFMKMRSSYVNLILRGHLEAPKPYDYRTLKNFTQESNTTLGVLLTSSTSTPTMLGERLWSLPVTMIF